MQEYRRAVASGKLILLGEHLVLQNGVSVAVPFKHEACVVEITPAETFSLNVFPAPSTEVLAALQADWDALTTGTTMETQPVCVNVQFHLPPGGGFGMSASWSVALVRSVQTVLGWSDAQCLEALQKLENAHHGGRASGIDHVTIWQQQPQALINGQTEPLAIKKEHLAALQPFYTGDPAETTAQMIERVKRAKIKPYSLNKNIVHSLKGNTLDEFMGLINQAGIWLEDSGAVNPQIAARFQAFRLAGGAVKICGAGGFAKGSGAAVAWNSDPTVLADFLAAFEAVA